MSAPIRPGVGSTEFPRFAFLLASQRQPDAISEMFKDPPVIFMTLADVESQLRNIRGVYEATQPDINTELALKRGVSSTQWLTREPDWRKARHINDPLVLFELTPVLIKRDGKEFYLHARWIIEVTGERAQRAMALLNLTAHNAIYPRLERAG